MKKNLHWNAYAEEMNGAFLNLCVRMYMVTRSSQHDMCSKRHCQNYPVYWDIVKQLMLYSDALKYCDTQIPLIFHTGQIPFGFS